MSAPTRLLNASDRAPTRAAWITAYVMMIVYAMNFLDRQLVATLAKPITESLGLNDAEFGLLTGFAFVVLFAVFALPAGWLADRVKNRVRLVSIIYGVWSLATILTGMAQNFAHMVVARALCGIGEGGGTPACVPVVADSFPPDRRGVALGIYNLGVPIGQGLGISIGAAIAAAVGWRYAFYALGVFGVVMALALPFLVRAPERGMHDDPVPAPGSGPPAQHAKVSIRDAFATIKSMFRDRILMLSVVSQVIAVIFFYGLTAFLVLFLMRNKGMTLPEIATWLGPFMAVSLAISAYGSGWLCDWFCKRRNYGAGYGLISVAGSVLAIAGTIGALLAPDWPLALACAVVAIGGGISWLPVLEALTQNRLMPSQRGVGVSVLVLMDNLIGMAIGPTLVGAASTYFADLYPHSHLPVAMAVVLVPIAVLAFLFFMLLWRSFKGTYGKPSILLGT